MISLQYAGKKSADEQLPHHDVAHASNLLEHQTLLITNFDEKGA